MAKKRECEDPATWQRRVDEWRRSGLTVTEFARQRGLASSTWLKWRKVLGGEQATRRAAVGAAPARAMPLVARQTVPFEGRDGASCSPVTFIELPAVAATSSTAGYGVPFEVALRSGRRLQVPASFDPDTLERLVSILEGR